MSYDIRLIDPESKATIELETPLDIRGGTYQVGGTTEAWLNVTYNYAPQFKTVFGEKGIRSLYGMTGEQAIPPLEAAIAALGTETTENYWDATRGNAGAALANLLLLCKTVPHGILEGD